MVTFPIWNSPPNTWFVTLTYSKPVKMISQWIKDIKAITNWLSKSGQFQLVAEIGENGNFHWHYIIHVKDDIKHRHFLNYWKYHNGFINIKIVNNYLGSYLYIRKQSQEMGEVMREKFADDRVYYNIITNSTAPYMIEKIRQKLIETNRSTKKINELYRTIEKMKVGLDAYYDLN